MEAHKSTAPQEVETMGELHASLARVIIRIYTIKTMLCLMLASGLQQASTLSRQQSKDLSRGLHDVSSLRSIFAYIGESLSVQGL